MLYFIERGRLESFTADDFGTSAEALLQRAVLRVGTSARVALGCGDIEGAFVLAYDGYRIAAESLLARQGLRATGGDGSHVTVEDAASAQFAKQIPAFAKATFERFRRTRHSVQYWDPGAAPITRQDAEWAIEKAAAAVDGARRLLADSPIGEFVIE